MIDLEGISIAVTDSIDWDAIVSCDYETKKESIMTVWLCGRYGEKVIEEINGIFSTEQSAINRCKDRFDFIIPFDLDEEMPEEKTAAIGCYYPLSETPEEGAARIKAYQKQLDSEN